MARFGISDIIDARSKELGKGGINEYKEIWLNPYDVKPSESNFYSQENIEELADSFLTVGQQQPTVLGRINGEFHIVSGHRRNLANIRNLERGHEEYRKVRYLYKDMTPAVFELSLLIGNAYNRELTAWEKTEQAKRLKEALLKAKKEDGLEIKGKMRDVIAGLMNESSTGIARMDSIQNNAIAEIKEELRKGAIGICAAYEASRLPREEQKALAAKVTENGRVRIKEVTERARRKTAVIEDKGAAGCQKEEGKDDIREQIAASYSGVIQKWVKENMCAPTKEAEDAIRKVSKMDTSQKDWGNTEWTVFMAKAIMNRADYVSREDLYLLHDIMERSGRKSI